MRNLEHDAGCLTRVGGKCDCGSSVRALLLEVSEFLDGYVDVRDGSDGRPLPNKAMLLKADVDAEIERSREPSELENGYANGYATAIETAAQHVENQHCVWDHTDVPTGHIIQTLANNIRALQNAPKSK